MTDLLDSLVPDAYPYLRGRIRLAAADGEPVRDCGELRDGATIIDVLDRYTECFAGADRRAALSLWSMYYFSYLVTGPLLFWLKERRVIPLSLSGTRLCLDRETGGPAGFLIAAEGDLRCNSTVFEAMADAIRHHADPLIESMADAGAVSPKLLWNNLAVYAEWAIREFSAGDRALEAEALELVLCEAWPDGWKNPMAGQLRRESDANGACFTRRKVCCLRYLLPGVPGCGMICPLPAGRK